MALVAVGLHNRRYGFVLSAEPHSRAPSEAVSMGASTMTAITVTT